MIENNNSDDLKEVITFCFDADLVEHLVNNLPEYNKRVEALIRDAWQRGQL